MLMQSALPTFSCAATLNDIKYFYVGLSHAFHRYRQNQILLPDELGQPGRVSFHFMGKGASVPTEPLIKVSPGHTSVGAVLVAIICRLLSYAGLVCTGLGWITAHCCVGRCGAATPPSCPPLPPPMFSIHKLTSSHTDQIVIKAHYLIGLNS